MLDTCAPLQESCYKWSVAPKCLEACQVKSNPPDQQVTGLRLQNLLRRPSKYSNYESTVNVPILAVKASMLVALAGTTGGDVAQDGPLLTSTGGLGHSEVSNARV